LSFEPFLGDGIFNVDGVTWKRQRQVASTIFTKNELIGMGEIFIKNGKKVLSFLESEAKSKEKVDLQEIFQKFTLDSIGEIAFGVEIGSMDKKVRFAQEFDDANKFTVFRSFNLLFRLKALNWLLPLSNAQRSLFKSIQYLNEFSYNIIQDRRKDPTLPERSDLLSKYLSLTDDEGKPFTDKYLRDIMINIMLAGRDTTSQLLTWTCYLLSQNPEKEQKLIEEIERTLKGEEPDIHNTKDMIYLKAVLNETLRLWPPVPAERKVAVVDDTLPNGIFIPKDTIVVWSLYSMGRMSEYWDKPNEYMPERWLSDDKTSLVHHQAFMPFLIGPRSCLGQNMAYIQAKILMCLMYQKFTFQHVPDHKVTYDISVTLKAKYGMMMFVNQRKGS